MWIAKNYNWHHAATELEKFVIERVIQRCDFSESVSNKHRTSNGYTQLKELIHYCELTQKRSKTVRSLIVLMEEAKSPHIRQNIIQDCIVEHFFKDLQTYINEFTPSTLRVERNQPNLVVLQNLTHRLKVYEKQLDAHYFTCLKKEFLAINYSETKEVLRNLNRVSQLIDVLIPFLVFKGYSQATIREILRHWLKCGYHIKVSKFLSFFHFEERKFSFLQYLGSKGPESKDFLRLLKKHLNVKVEEVDPKKMDAEFIEKYELDTKGTYASYSYQALDPHTHVRSNFDLLLKKLVTQRERQSLSVFNSFFENSFWYHKPNQPFRKYKKVALEGDPINVSVRGKTLRTTLITSSEDCHYTFTKNDHIPDVRIEKLENAIYYYNLALGSKSIENSLSLLWTSLESTYPFKIHSSDIDAIQSFMSKVLSLGAKARDIHSFALRFIHVNQQNGYTLTSLGTAEFESIESTVGLLKWFQWMRQDEGLESKFNAIKSCSELLAYQFLSVARPLREGKQEDILNRITRSESSVQYQLQRIYLHRNKIVHSGDMINEYTNLWMHLEWYVGKILAYFIIQLYYIKKHSTMESAALELEADHSYLIGYLDKNREKQIGDLPSRIVNTLFKHSWLAF